MVDFRVETEVLEVPARPVFDHLSAKIGPGSIAKRRCRLHLKSDLQTLSDKIPWASPARLGGACEAWKSDHCTLGAMLVLNPLMVGDLPR